MLSSMTMVSIGILKFALIWISPGVTPRKRGIVRRSQEWCFCPFFSHFSHGTLLTSNTAIQQYTLATSSPKPSPGGCSLLDTPTSPTNSPSSYQQSTPSLASLTSSSSYSPAETWWLAQPKSNTPKRPHWTKTPVNMGTYLTRSSRTQTRMELYLISTRGVCMIIRVRRWGIRLFRVGLYRGLVGGGGMGYPPTSIVLRNEGLMHGRSNSFEDEEDYGRLPG